MKAGSKPIPSIWQDLPVLAMYPMRPEVLGLIVGYSLLRLISYALGSSVAIQWLPTFAISGDTGSIAATLLGCLLELLLLILSLKLAVEALLNTAKDRLDPGKVGALWASDDAAGGHILLWLFFVAVSYFLALVFGMGMGGFALAVILVILPAAVIVLTMDESLLRALNPAAWWALVERLGPAYFSVVALLGLLAVVVFGVEWLIFARLPGWIGALLTRFLDLYALVLAYHLMGHLLYQHREQLGIDVTPPIARPVFANLEEDSTMQQADTLVAENAPDAAIELLRSLIHRRGASAPIHTRYRQLLLEKKDFGRLNQHGREHVAVLLALHQVKQALALHIESRALDPEFQLDVPEDITRLIEYAAACGHSKLAVELAAGFDVRFPRNADVPQNMLLVANLMAERLGREKEARQILIGLRSRYSEHPLAPDIKLALAEVELLVARNQR